MRIVRYFVCTTSRVVDPMVLNSIDIMSYITGKMLIWAARTLPRPNPCLDLLVRVMVRLDAVIGNEHAVIVGDGLVGSLYFLPVRRVLGRLVGSIPSEEIGILGIDLEIALARAAQTRHAGDALVLLITLDNVSPMRRLSYVRSMSMSLIHLLMLV